MAGSRNDPLETVHAKQTEAESHSANENRIAEHHFFGALSVQPENPRIPELIP